MYKFPLALICFTFLGINLVLAQESVKPEMKTYTFVMLTRGANTSQDSITRAQIQKGHLAHITSMAETGDLNVAGPFLDDGFWRGILIFNTTDTLKVKRLVEEDPAVKAGRLSYQIHPWMTQKGASFK